MEDIQEIQYSPITILLTFGEYFKINHSVSLGEGFDISDSTARYWGVNPRAAKTNIAVVDDVETYEPKLVLEVDTYIQRKHPELLESFEPVDSWVPVGEDVQEMIVDLTDLQVIDWTIKQYFVSHSERSGMKLLVDESLINSLPDEVMSQLDGIGIQLEVIT